MVIPKLDTRRLIEKVNKRSKPFRSHKRDWSREIFYSFPKSLTI